MRLMASNVCLVFFLCQETLSNPQFCGKDGPRTFFTIVSKYAVSIADYSAYAAERELVLAPGATLQVVSVMDAGNGLTMIQLEEMDTPLAFDEIDDMYDVLKLSLFHLFFLSLYNFFSFFKFFSLFSYQA
jgi:hypothetical protein